MSRLSRTASALAKRQASKDGSMAALARRAGVRYALVRRVCRANAAGDDLGTAPADAVSRLLRHCGSGGLVIRMGGQDIPLG